MAEEDGGGGGQDAVVHPDADSPADMGPAANCDNNPASCETGRLRGPPPACMCLNGCTAGYTWNGTTCVQDDAGFAPDAAPAPDADPAPDANEPADAGFAPDADPVVNPDATPGADAPVVVVPDTGVGNPDALPGQDAVVVGDTGVVADGGIVMGDAGNRDSGVIVADGGVVTDGGFVPSGLAEGDDCNWQQPNNCLQVPGMICQQLDPQDPTAGICLRTCNVAQNTPGGSLNTTCSGVGRNCVDIGLPPLGGRCLTALGPYVPFAGVLDICDPAIPNLQSVDGVSCWPLCTVTPGTPPGPTLTCSGTYNTCITQFAFDDGAGGSVAACGIRGTRNSTCAEDLGRHCAVGDACLLGRCHQLGGATCTGVTCTVPGTTCSVVGTANPTAVCHRTCPVFGANTCVGTDACDLTGFAGSANATAGSCRAVSGAVPALGDCSDPLALGTNANDCVAGTTCIPVGASGEFDEAACLQLCSGSIAGAPACPAGLTCQAFGGQFQSFGVCF